MSGSSLSGYADGSLSGFLKTACTINAGHPECGTPNGWSSRQQYWAAANKCLGAGGGGGGGGGSSSLPSCDNGNGQCVNRDVDNTCSGQWVYGECPGGNNIECCSAGAPPKKHHWWDLQGDAATHHSTSAPAGEIAGIVIGCTILVAIIAVAYIRDRNSQRAQTDADLEELVKSYDEE